MLCTKVFGGDGLEADDLQSSGSQNQLAAPRVEVLQKDNPRKFSKHHHSKPRASIPACHGCVKCKHFSVVIKLSLGNKVFSCLLTTRGWTNVGSCDLCAVEFLTLRRSARRVSMSVEMDGMSLTHWQYSKKIRISSRTVLKEHKGYSENLLKLNVHI